MRELRVKLNDEIKWQLLDIHALAGVKEGFCMSVIESPFDFAR